MTATHESNPGWPGDRAPRTQREVAEVLSSQPPAWEYLYFVGVLQLEKQALEGRYSEYTQGQPIPTREWIADEDVVEYVQQVNSELLEIITGLNTMMHSDLQERAFGAPGVVGDAAQIKRLAKRWSSYYAAMLDWAGRVRGTGHSSKFDRSFELVAKLADNPIEEYRQFIDAFTAEIDRVPAVLASKQPFKLNITLTVTIADGLGDELVAEVRRALTS